MDNIVIEKQWYDGELIEIKICAKSEFINVYQECYISESDLVKAAEHILEYIEKCENECYVEYGNKSGNFTPAFSMKFLPIDIYGHIKIEMDMEIADNNTRSHRCSFYVNTEIGLVEQFAHKILMLVKAEVGYYIELVE